MIDELASIPNKNVYNFQLVDERATGNAISDVWSAQVTKNWKIIARSVCRLLIDSISILFF